VGHKYCTSVGVGKDQRLTQLLKLDFMHYSFLGINYNKCRVYKPSILMHYKRLVKMILQGRFPQCPFLPNIPCFVEKLSFSHLMLFYFLSNAWMVGNDTGGNLAPRLALQECLSAMQIPAAFST